MQLISRRWKLQKSANFTITVTVSQTVSPNHMLVLTPWYSDLPSESQETSPGLQWVAQRKPLSLLQRKSRFVRDTLLLRLFLILDQNLVVSIFSDSGSQNSKARLAVAVGLIRHRIYAYFWQSCQYTTAQCSLFSYCIKSHNVQPASLKFSQEQAL